MADEEKKLPFTAFLRSVSTEKFAEIFSASTRKARETYFHRHGVKATSSATRLPKPGAKNEARIALLYEVLQAEDDHEMAEEILRTWLLAKRPLLAAALDHLGIKHDNGLTDSDDIKKFEKLGKKDVRTMVEKLEAVSPREDAILYLKFMGVPEVDEKLG